MNKKIDVSFIESNPDIVDQIMDQLEKDPNLVVQIYDGDVHKANMIPYDTFKEMEDITKNVKE